MVRRFRFRQIGAGTQVYALAGNPILHSLSPAMQNAAFEACGIDAVYVPVQAADFEDFVTFADALPLAGASVTIPFKLDALQRASRADAVAVAVGAANTLRRVADGWEATNTDVDGFLAPLLDLEQATAFRLAGCRAAVLGAGGAARAVVHGLRSRGAHVTVHARTAGRARALAAAADAAAGEWPAPAGSWDLLVNSTPVGSMTSPLESPVPAGGLRGGAVVYDLIYAPAQTRLLEDAEEAGCATIGGLPMLIAQAERQFAWWTGQPAPRGVMARAAAEAIEKRNHERHETYERRTALS
jgi:shikimate dehydrogenase